MKLERLGNSSEITQPLESREVESIYCSIFFSLIWQQINIEHLLVLC